MEQNIAIKILSALAHDGRLSLIRHLVTAGPVGLSAGRLASLARIRASTASAQLVVLTNAGLIRSVRRGRSIIYFAEFGTLTALLSFMMSDCCAGEPDICDPLAKLCCR